MFDAKLRPIIDQMLDPVGGWLARHGVTANQVTLGGAFFGLLAFVFIAINMPLAGFLLVLLNRLADGIDGAIARSSRQSDFGGYLDMVADFIFYSAIPLAFAISNPENATAACFLCVSFMGTASSFLGFAILAAKHDIKTEVQGKKAFYYLGGLTEGAETMIVLCIMTIWPTHFVFFAWSFGTLCWVTTCSRVYMTYGGFGHH